MIQNENYPKKIDSVASNFLKMAIKKYQFDVVGWTEYCIDNTKVEDEMLPVYREKPFEGLLVSNKLATISSIPSIQKVYDSQETYIDWLENEYARDQAFYEDILKNPERFVSDIENEALNEEINLSAENYINVIEKNKIDEIAVIDKISFDDWLSVQTSQYPKVQLGILLGAVPESIVNNFAVYFFNQLKSHFVGSNTAFMSSTGPASWHEMEKCKRELGYFREQALNPSIQNLLLTSSEVE